jgi:hypothetical protein
MEREWISEEVIDELRLDEFGWAWGQGPRGYGYEGVKELPSTDDWGCAVKRHLLSR